MIEFLTKNDVADVIQHNNTEQHATSIDHREHVSLGFRDDLDHLTQIVLRMHLFKISFYHALDIHECQYRLILVMSHQFSLLSKTHGINTMRLEYHNSKVRTYRNHHQRKEEVVSTGQLSNEEDTCQWSMHYPRHHARHPHQGKILFRNIIRDKRCQRISIAEMRKDESHHTSQEQTRGKCTPATSTTIGSTRCKYLEQNNQSQINQQQVAISVEDRVVHYLIPIGSRRTIEQHMDGIVAFTIKRREHEDEDTQHDTPYRKLDVRIAVSAENSFNSVHGTGKIEGHQTTKNTQQQYGRNTFHQEWLVHAEFKHRLRTMQDIGYRSSCHTRHEQRKQRPHGQVNHQYFEGKHQAGNRGFKDTCNRTGCTTSHQHHERTVLHLEHATQVGTDGRTRQYNRRFGPYRSTKTDGDGTGKKRRPGIVPLDSALPARDGIQNLGHPVTDIVSHHIADEKTCQQDTNNRIHQIQPVHACSIEVLRQEVLDVFNQELQQAGRQSR